jgi:hypothetical protein
VQLVAADGLGAARWARLGPAAGPGAEMQAPVVTPVGRVAGTRAQLVAADEGAGAVSLRSTAAAITAKVARSHHRGTAVELATCRWWIGVYVTLSRARPCQRRLVLGESPTPTQLNEESSSNTRTHGQTSQAEHEEAGGSRA